MSTNAAWVNEQAPRPACCFAPPEAWSEERVRLDRDETHYLTRVLRLKAGAEVRVVDGLGREGRGRLHAVTPAAAGVLLDSLRRHVRAQPRKVLIQALIRGPRMEWLLQKATELGADSIVVFQARRSVVRWSGGDERHKVARWQRIVREAARQCGVPWLPVIVPPRDGLPLPGDSIPRTVLWGCLAPDARPLLNVLQDLDAESAKAEVGFLIGPEGDLAPEEESALRDAGAIPVSLGPLTLRAETAALYALSAMGCYGHARYKPPDLRSRPTGG